MRRLGLESGYYIHLQSWTRRLSKLGVPFSSYPFSLAVRIRPVRKAVRCNDDHGGPHLGFEMYDRFSNRVNNILILQLHRTLGPDTVSVKSLQLCSCISSSANM